MPDDNPLDPPSNDPVGAAEPAVNDSVGRYVADAMGPLIEQIQGLAANQEQTQRALQQLAESRSEPQQRYQAPAEPEEDFLTELTSGNAEAAIRRRVAAVVQEQMGGLTPMLSNLLHSGSAAFTNIEAENVDRQFGQGAYASLLEKPMGQIMAGIAKSDPSAYADSSTIRREINGLKGQMFDQLVEYREKSRQKEAAGETTKLASLVDGVAEGVLKRTNGTGGLRRIATGEREVTPELKGYIDERIRGTGKPIDAKKWLEETDFDGNLDSYKAHMAKMAKQNGATH